MEADQIVMFGSRNAEFFYGCSNPYYNRLRRLFPLVFAVSLSLLILFAFLSFLAPHPGDSDRLPPHVSGAVVVARYGEIYRGDIVRNAYKAGAVGIVIYTDKIDYGGGDECFPESRWMPPSGVQVGTVYNGLGDLTTPGWASVDGCERLSEESVELRGDSPGIPSLPISAADAEVILRSVVGGIGPGILNLSYVGKTVIAEIENVIGVIEGEQEPDRSRIYEITN